ncbi:MAG: alpha/beta fold hydrolase [Acidimicrobiales bacterium]
MTSRSRGSRLRNASLIAGAVTAGLPALWTTQHLRSRAVRNWTAPTLPGRWTDPLYARSGGQGNDAVVLLHGLVSSGDVFGAAYDGIAIDRRLLVPDLLGFGRSLDHMRAEFTVGDHLDALDSVVEHHGLDDARVTIGAHSMGSALALLWARRHSERVERIVCWGAPIFASPEAARRRISGSTMTRLFALDTTWARRACALSCHHRTAAGWLSASAEPRLPVPIARAASLHTWPAYRDAICGLVIETNWPTLMGDLDSKGIGVDLVWGTEDRVGDHRIAHEIVKNSEHSTMTIVDGAGHHLPMTHPALCLSQLNATDVSL